MITHEEVKQYLHYDPNTGVFLWRHFMSSRANAAYENFAKEHHGEFYKEAG